VRLSSLGTSATVGLLYQPRMIDDDDYGAVGGMRIDRGNRSTRRKPAPVPLCTPQIPHDLTWDWTRAAAVGSQRLTAWALARPPVNYPEPLQSSSHAPSYLFKIYFNIILPYTSGSSMWGPLVRVSDHNFFYIYIYMILTRHKASMHALYLISIMLLDLIALLSKR
jgi:hypothetical protein